MRTHKSSYVHPPYKTKHRVENWAEYEKGLRDRGDLTIWFSEAAIAAWTPAGNGKRGGQQQYSDLAIETALTLWLVFHLPLQQTEGFVGSLLTLMKLKLKAPDHTTLSRRGSKLEVALRRQVPAGPIHLIVDSTGLKSWNWERPGRQRSVDEMGDQIVGVRPTVVSCTSAVTPCRSGA